MAEGGGEGRGVKDGVSAEKEDESLPKEMMNPKQHPLFCQWLTVRS